MPGFQILFHRLKSSGTLQQPDNVAGDRYFPYQGRKSVVYRIMSECDRLAEKFQDVASEQAIGTRFKCLTLRNKDPQWIEDTLQSKRPATLLIRGRRTVSVFDLI